MSLLYDLLSLHKGEADKDKVREDVVNNISFRGANLWILACAILIASIGLNVNSTAVIIGAMLISPLMGPIVGSGFALATYDFSLLKRSAKNLIIATLVGLIVSCVYFYLSPFKDVESEILARTSPTIYDVLIAFFGGIVGAVSITRVEKGNPIPGVAIATALMPPLCTAGFGLATLNMKFVAGAMYLYSINCFFIGISTFLVLKYLKYPAVKTENLALDKKVRILLSFLMLLMIVPSFFLAYGLLQEKKFSQNVERFINNQFTQKGYTVIYKKVNYSGQPKLIELAFLSQKFDSAEIKRLNNDLSSYGIENARVVIKQNDSDLKKEILTELNKSANRMTDRDLKMEELMNELSQYQVGSSAIDEEVKIIFPEIQEVSFAVLTDYAKESNIQKEIVIIYSSNAKVEEEKLKTWLIKRLDVNSIRLIQANK